MSLRMDEGEAKLKRRNAKAALTRTGNALVYLVEKKRPGTEVRAQMEKFQKSFGELEIHHSNYTELIEDEKAFEQEEEYLKSAQDFFLETCVTANDFLNSYENTRSSSETELVTAPRDSSARCDSTKGDLDDSETDSLDSSGNDDGVTQKTKNMSGTSSSSSNIHCTDGHRCDKKVSLEGRNLFYESKDCSMLKCDVARPKLPKFSGDVRDYSEFKSDFKYMIESRYHERDSVTLLRSALVGKPLDLVKGLGQDYRATWECLDSVYGDPRFLTDAVTNDISKFKPLSASDDSRFCDLVHLINRSYNLLKEAGRPNDMDNNHMIAIIEQKMCMEDRKLWARESEKLRDLKLIDLQSWMANEMKARIRATAALRTSSYSKSSKVTVNQVASNDERGHDYKCWVCQSSDHYPDQCETFASKSEQERFQLAKRNRICFSCLKKAGKNHRASNCSRRKECEKLVNGSKCNKYHHKLLHYDNSAIVGVASIEHSCKTLLPIVLADVIGPDKESHESNIMLDSGSQLSLIRKSLAEELNLTGKDVTLTITKVGGEEEILVTKMYSFTIRSLYDRKQYNVKAAGIEFISDDVTDEANNMNAIAKLFELNQSLLKRKSGPVDILIGVDQAKLHVGKTKEKMNLIARCSPLGWTVFGGLLKGNVNATTILHVKRTEPVDMTQFWKNEAMGVNPRHCTCEAENHKSVEEIEARVIESSCQKVGNQWLIPYPWKKDPTLLPNNIEQAKRSLQSKERQLLRNPDLAESYDKQMKDMIKMKFARQLTKSEIDNYTGPIFYIPHHAVIREDSNSTPLRIVFNSSVRYRGQCLNDFWLKGPDLLNDLFGILLRFRENEIGLCGDISKMYHRILIPEIDQHIHRFLWRNLETDREPDVYVKTVLTFGDKPAPAMAQIALKKTAEEARDEYPVAHKILTENVYMDDICDSFHSKKEALNHRKEIDEILKNGGFEIKQWTMTTKTENASDVDDSERKTEKVLGVLWNSVKDELHLRSVAVNTDQIMWTKRNVLSMISKIFDPLGLVSAFLIRAKIELQHLWEEGMDWDTLLDQEKQMFWKRYFDELSSLNLLRFPRSVTPEDTVGQPMLCIFCDASENAFGACSYIRWKIAENKFESRLLCSKSRVAPLKKLSIPKLELQAALLATRLYKSIMDEMRLTFQKVILMTDSMITLGWIRATTVNSNKFVSNRVNEIQHETERKQWKHIPGIENVADDVSRGISLESLTGRWLVGPHFLEEDECHWPTDNYSNSDDLSTDEYVSINAISHEKHSTAVPCRISSVIDPDRFSSWKRLLRVTSYVLRFIRNLKNKGSKLTGPPSPNEMLEAENLWIIDAQIDIKSEVQRGKFKSLSCFIDENEVYRVGGRLDRSSFLTYDAKHPVLLPGSKRISKLIMIEYHCNGHSGVSSTVAKSRRKFWITNGHKLAKSIKFQCVPCRKLAHKVSTQKMSDLPDERLKPFSPPFHYTSCDYFGPYAVKLGRNKTMKNYGVIFTCLNTRAVHIDLATDCSTEEFLQVLRRFVSFRGCPSLILSDNGTQFIGAERQIKEMLNNWTESVKEFCGLNGITWKFTTPSAPHQNGVTEALVKSCKRALKLSIGDQVLKPFELYTVLCEVSNLLNQRPIGRHPNDPDDGGYLCPNDILLGRATTNVPPGPFQEKENYRNRFLFVQNIIDSFWKRWSNDILPNLFISKRWTTEKENIKIDDIVVMSDNNAVRGKWTLGRVIDVFPGKDSLIRNVLIKTASGNFRRPIQKIAIIK